MPNLPGRTLRCLLTLVAWGSTLLSRWGAGAELALKVVARDGAPMVLVPAGRFMMGSADGDRDEMPPHQLDLPAFYIDQFEVTNAQ
jgi:sulfatase modifying factor 1